MQLDSLDIKVLKENFSDEEIAKMDALNIFKMFIMLRIYYYHLLICFYYQ